MDLSVVVGLNGPVPGVEVSKESSASVLLAYRLELLGTKINGEDITEVLRAGVSKDTELASAILLRYADQNNVMDDVSRNGHIVKFMASENRTEEACIQAVKTDAFVISHLTDKERTEPVCIAAAKAFGQSTFFMTKAQRTEPVLVSAMKKNGLSIRHYDEDEKTPAVCEAAAHQAGIAIRYMSDAQKTLKVCGLAAKQNGHALKHMTPSQRTESVCINGIVNNGYAAKHLIEDDFSVAVANAIHKCTPKIKSTEKIHHKATEILLKNSADLLMNAETAMEFIKESSLVKNISKQLAHA